MRASTITGLGVLMGLTLALNGCVVAPVEAERGYYYGPPPHAAPISGHRYRNGDGLIISYDSGLGVYLVVGYPGLYWWNDYYYRERSGYWEWSHRHLGPWDRPRVERLPSGLRKRYEQEHRRPDWDRDRYREPERPRDYRDYQDRYRDAPQRDLRREPAPGYRIEPQRDDRRDWDNRRDWENRPGPDDGRRVQPSTTPRYDPTAPRDDRNRQPYPDQRRDRDENRDRDNGRRVTPPVQPAPAPARTPTHGAPPPKPVQQPQPPRGSNVPRYERSQPENRPQPAPKPAEQQPEPENPMYQYRPFPNLEGTDHR